MRSILDVLVTLDELRRREPAIRAATAATVTAADVQGAAAEFFRYYVLFSEGLATSVGLDGIDTSRAFYNSYYWFERFVRAQSEAHGYDAGLEQQAHQLLEDSPIELDPDVMTEIAERLEQDAAG